MSGDANHWMVQARHAFCADTPFTAPSEVIHAGLKTPADWCETLDQYRSAITSPTRVAQLAPNLTRNTKLRGSASTVRRQVLEVVAQHCRVSEGGLTAREVGERLNRSYQSAYEHLTDLLDDGQLIRVEPRGGMPRNTVCYRVAGAKNE